MKGSVTISSVRCGSFWEGSQQEFDNVWPAAALKGTAQWHPPINICLGNQSWIELQQRSHYIQAAVWVEGESFMQN